MSSRAPSSGPLRAARSCYDHLAGQLGTAVARTAIDRGWVLEQGDDWRLSDDAADQTSRALGLDVRPDPASRRPDLRRCMDWTEHRPHLAGAFGAAVLDALLEAGWLERVPGGRVLAVTPVGAERLRRTGIQGVIVDESGCDADNLCYSGGVAVTAAAAEDWGALVERAAREGLTGVAALAGFAGTVADAVVQNFSAYGQQVADVVWSVRSWDRTERAQRTFAMMDCGFRTGGSRFTPEDGRRRYDVLEVAFLFRAGTITAPLRDADLARLLGVQLGDRVPLPRVREAVLTAAR
jgi:UDP-N-acetylmuramate dehydrogenase